MAVTDPSSSPVNATVTKFYEAVTVWDFDAFEELFSEDYEHRRLPASVNAGPPKNKEDDIKHIKKKAFAALLGNAHLNIFRWIELTGGVWVSARASAANIPGPGLSVSSTLRTSFAVSSEGDKIVTMKESVDIVFVADFIPAATASLSAQQ